MIPITEKNLSQVIRPRAAESHKGNYGRVVIIGGNQTYGGAGIMSASAALYTGAGLITLASDPVNRTALHATHPEIMFVNWHERAELAPSITAADVIVIGPGLGLDGFARELLTWTLATVTKTQTLILDGSALTLIAQAFAEKQTSGIESTAAQLILTPHQEEWHRLSQLPIAAQTVAQNQGALTNFFPPATILVLKQHRTQVYAGEACFENTSGHPAMATGGMGDTLTGIIAAMIGQFKSPLAATNAAVYLHGLAGETLARTHYVVLPSQLIRLVPRLMTKYAQMTD